MALPFKCRILFFCLVLLMGCTSGVRNTIKQDSKECDQVYVTAYGTGTAIGQEKVEVENDHKENPTYTARNEEGAGDEINQPYITGYGGEKEMNSSYVRGAKESNNPYVTSNGGEKETNPSYVTSYGGAKKSNQPSYVTSYGGAKESNQRYVTSYGGEKETNPSYGISYRGAKKSNQPYYVTSYGGAKEQNQRYVTSYGGEKKTNPSYGISYRGAKKSNQPSYVTSYGGAKEQNQRYVTSYGGEKKTNPSYRTSYGGAKELNQRYITSYRGEKETNLPYVTSYGGDKKTNQPYVTGNRGKKQTTQPYITHNRGKKQTNQPYITQYGDTKETNQPYATSYGSTKETNQPYIIAYGEAKENNRRPHITGYVNTKADQRPYITGYNDGKGTEEHPYVTMYGDSNPKSKCKSHLHTGHDHMMGHENHMQAQTSTDMDHTEAFKVGFFTPDDLYAGKIMPLYFPIEDHSSRFLPGEVAESIPFSVSQLPNLLQLFSTPQGSPEANGMEETLRDCELKAINGEIKLCATSLESMVEFARSIIGSQVNLNLLSTTHPTMATDITQNYTVLEGPKQVLAPKMVFCHPQPYPYAVFFCHFFGTETKVLQVPVRGDSGDDVEAMAVCHMDTSDWDPNHVLFSLLGFKPGASSPVCHFLPKNHLVWIPSPTTATV